MRKVIDKGKNPSSANKIIKVAMSAKMIPSANIIL